MSERDDVIEPLRAAGVLDGIRWAHESACGRTMDDFEEDAGHDGAWLGCTRHVLLRDRLDRVFASGRYTLDQGSEVSEGLDLVYAQLTARDIAAMPNVTPSTVRRDDLNNSPGWGFESIRFLIASAPFGRIDRLPWPRKSPTKQLVASQPNPEPLPTLFDDFPPGEVAGLAAAVDEELVDRDTFVVAHSLDPVDGLSELVFGRPRINEGGGPAWFWYVDLRNEPPTETRRNAEPPSPSSPPDVVPDAPVRLRRRDGRDNRGASGKR